MVFKQIFAARLSTLLFQVKLRQECFDIFPGEVENGREKSQNM